MSEDLRAFLELNLPAASSKVRSRGAAVVQAILSR